MGNEPGVMQTVLPSSHFGNYRKEVALPLVREPPSHSALPHCIYSFSLKVKRRGGFYFTLSNGHIFTLFRVLIIIFTAPLSTLAIYIVAFITCISILLYFMDYLNIFRILFISGLCLPTFTV